MFDEFKKVHDVFKNNGIKDPISETLKFFDVISGGALNNIDVSFLDPSSIDFLEVVRKRKAGIPMEYIIGRATFGGLDLICTNDTLIPTEYTSLLVEIALGYIEEKQQSGRTQTIIEVGTGCGNIAILLALLTNGVKIFASDISSEALDVARKNVEKYNLIDTVELVYGDLFSPFDTPVFLNKIDMVLSNPPYIPTNLIDKLSTEIASHQPKIALDGGPYGISFYQRLAHEAIPLLKTGGRLIFEIGERQEKMVSWIMNQKNDYTNIRYHKDHGGIVRVVSASKDGASPT